MGEEVPTAEATNESSQPVIYEEERERMTRAASAINFAAGIRMTDYPEGFAESSIPDQVAARARASMISGV